MSPRNTFEPHGSTEFEGDPSSEVLALFAKPEDQQQAAPPLEYEMTCLADVEPEQIEWLWPHRIALGKLSILAGDGGLGKSTITLDMAARVSTGKPWPDAPDEHTEPGSVVLLSAEDGLADTIRPRLDAAEADLRKIHALTGVRRGKDSQASFNLKRDVGRLEDALRRYGDTRLVIIDPVSAFIGDADDHKNGVVRGFLAQLAGVAERNKVAIVLVHHFNKNVGGKTAYRLNGSGGYYNAVRSVWSVVPDPNDPDRRLMLRSKSNLSGKMSGLAFRIEGGAIRWEESPVDLSPDEVLATEGQPPKKATPMQRAKDLLRQMLADGETPFGEISRRAAEEGISPGIMQRAAGQLGIIRRKDGFGGQGPWLWSLPPGSPHRRSPTPSGNSVNNGAYDGYGPDPDPTNVSADFVGP